MGKLSFVAATIFAAAMALVSVPSSQPRSQAPAPYLEPQAPISIETDAEIRSEIVVPMTIEAPRRAAKTAKAAKAAEDCETWRKGKIWGGKWRPLCDG